MSGQITALYHNLYDAGRAIEDLVASGVAPDEISLVTSAARAPILEVECEESARRSAPASGAIGGALGVIGARLTTSPGGRHGILATGPMLRTLTDARSRGPGFAAALQRFGISRRDARFFEHEVRQHDALVIGVTSIRYEGVVVRNILERHHATAVSEPA